MTIAVPMSGMNVTIETVYELTGDNDWQGPNWGAPDSEPTAQCPYQLIPRDTGIWLSLDMQYGIVHYCCGTTTC